MTSDKLICSKKIYIPENGNPVPKRVEFNICQELYFLSALVSGISKGTAC